jgi:hypothetical protein
MAQPRFLTALVLGGADTLETDRIQALSLFDPDLIVACNHAARDEPGRVDHWATMHPELLPGWLAQRRAYARPEPGEYWHPRHKAVQCLVPSRPVESWGGSSGLLCVAVAFELGCTHVVLAGVPMLKAHRHFDDPRPWAEARQYHPAWERHLPAMRGRVKSCSGWTREQLGAPSRGWFDGHTA